MAKKKPDEGLMSLSVAYGNISVGDKTARIGLSIDRGNITVNKADTTFTDKRLTCLLKARPNGDAPGQNELPGFEGETLTLNGVADVKGINAKGRTISIGLTFVIKSIDLQQLTHFAKREGELVVQDVADIPEDERGGDSGSGDEE